MRIREYIAEHRPEAAVRVATRIRLAVKHLEKHPEMGRDLDHRGVRELVITGTPYVVGYRVQEDRVEIVRVKHGRELEPR